MFGFQRNIMDPFGFQRNSRVREAKPCAGSEVGPWGRPGPIGAGGARGARRKHAVACGFRQRRGGRRRVGALLSCAPDALGNRKMGGVRPGRWSTSFRYGRGVIRNSATPYVDVDPRRPGSAQGRLAVVLWECRRPRQFLEQASV